MNNMSDLNVISSEAVEKLNFPMEQHPNPYKVSWITYNHLVMVQHRCLLSFSLENHFQDEVWCDIIPMTVCHLLLGK